jgi:hypothetical protein
MRSQTEKEEDNAAVVRDTEIGKREDSSAWGYIAALLVVSCTLVVLLIHHIRTLMGIADPEDRENDDENGGEDL